jgi:hypothetical protein
MKALKIFSFFIIVLLFSSNLFAQENFRIRTDFTTKEKFADGKMRLTMGTVYYDKNVSKLVYDIHFPQKETWVFVDTTCYMFRNDSLIKTSINPFFQKASIFHFALTNNLINFGLTDIVFDITSVKKDGDLILVTWTPKEKFQENFGEIITSKRDNKLYGVAIFSKDDVLISKQIFDNYIQVGNIDFPTKIIQIQYSSEGESYQITNYKNIVLNEMKNHYYYNFIVNR